MQQNDVVSRKGVLSLSVSQAAIETGISSDTIRRAIVDKQLPSFRPGRGRGRGGKIMILRKSLEKWLQNLQEIEV